MYKSKWTRIIDIIFVIFFVLIAAKIIYSFLYHIREEKKIAIYIKEKGFSKVDRFDKKYAFFISDNIRKEFNVDASTMKRFNLKKRPFFRNSVYELLTIREGACGEGTRVLVKIFLKLGLDATRITLYDKFLTPAHTLVSLYLDGKEYFIDSINSTKELNEFLRQNDINSEIFSFVPYKRRFEHANRPNIDEFDKFTNDFILYSYEAVSLNKLLGNIFNIRVFNFERPRRFLSYIAESYYLLTVLVWTFMLAGEMIFYLVWLKCKKNKN